MSNLKITDRHIEILSVMYLREDHNHWSSWDEYLKNFKEFFEFPEETSSERFWYDESGKVVAYSCMTLTQNIHYGLVASEVSTFVFPEADRSVRKSIIDYRKGFAKSQGARWIETAKHIDGSTVQLITKEV